MSAEAIRESLVKLSDVLEPLDTEELEPLSPEWMERQSLLHQQSRLLAQLDEESVEADVELRLDGSTVVGHLIDSTFFAELIGVFQKAVLSAAQTIMGEDSVGGTYSNAVRDVATLRLAPARPGSFVAPIFVPQRVEQLGLEGEDEGAPVVDDALGQVMGLLNDPGPGQGDALIEAAMEAGARTVKQVMALVARLRVSNTGVRVLHRPIGQALRTVTVRPATARRIEDLLATTHQQTEEMRLDGRLVGASWPQRRFELEVAQPDGSVEIYRGSVPTSLRREVSNNFDQNVSALVEITHTYTPTGEDRPSYRLIGLSTPGAPTLESMNEPEG